MLIPFTSCGAVYVLEDFLLNFFISISALGHADTHRALMEDDSGRSFIRKSGIIFDLEHDLAKYSQWIKYSLLPISIWPSS